MWHPEDIHSEITNSTVLHCSVTNDLLVTCNYISIRKLKAVVVFATITTHIQYSPTLEVKNG